MKNETVKFQRIAGATTSGEIIWIAEVETDGWLIARGEFATATEAWNWIYSL